MSSRTAFAEEGHPSETLMSYASLVPSASRYSL